MQQLYRRTHMPKCDFKLLFNFIEITLRHGCSRVNFLHIFRTPFPKNTSEGLFLANVFDQRICCNFHCTKNEKGSFFQINVFCKLWSVLTSHPMMNKTFLSDDFDFFCNCGIKKCVKCPNVENWTRFRSCTYKFLLTLTI